MMAVSDISVGMAVSTCSTISLICGRNAFHFDNTGNAYFPFARKYKNIIFFEDEDLLLEQLDNILSGKFNCADAIAKEDIRKYDAYEDDNAMERLRDELYVLTGKD